MMFTWIFYVDNRFDNISFDVVLRGYRQDQVDAVIENMQQRIIALENLTGTKEKG